MTVARIFAVAFAFVAAGAWAQTGREIYQPDPKDPGGFIDLDLKIESMNCLTWDNCSVLAKGVHQGKDVGLQIQIERKGARRLAIYYRSIGEASDRLLLAMAQLYKVAAPSKRFKKNAYADIVVLQIKDDVMANKVFFEVDRPGYAELYTNIDKRRGVLQIHEKDPEYRVNVLRGLAE